MRSRGSAARRRQAPFTASQTSAECSSAPPSPPKPLPSAYSRSGTSRCWLERRSGRAARGTCGCATPPSRRSCGTERAAAPTAICEECLGPLEPVYEPGRPLPDRETIAGRAPSLWRYKEWLPFDGDPVWSLDTGFTPLVDAPALARRFGVARVWVKNDTVSHPSLSFKDRVVAAAINAAAAFGLETIGCASTGNLANAVAAHAARAGLKAWIFIPDELEAGRVIGTSVYGARLVRVRGTYDDVNRLCAQVVVRPAHPYEAGAVDAGA